MFFGEKTARRLARGMRNEAKASRRLAADIDRSEANRKSFLKEANGLEEHAEYKDRETTVEAARKNSSWWSK